MTRVRKSPHHEFLDLPDTIRVHTAPDRAEVTALARDGFELSRNVVGGRMTSLAKELD